eukprot:jgi/Chlat1/1240/Chrsp115S00754
MAPRRAAGAGGRGAKRQKAGEGGAAVDVVAGSLWSSSDLARWSAALAAYDSRLKALNKPRLVGLEAAYRKSGEDARRQGFMTHDELVGVVEWKLSRGKFRPQLLGFARSLSVHEVEDATRRAFAALPKVDVALAALTELKGIGPATASAILSVYDDSVPFMSDEAMAAALPGRSIKYTVKEYQEFIRAVRAKAEALSSVKGGESLSACDVERALWSEAMRIKQPIHQIVNQFGIKDKKDDDDIEENADDDGDAAASQPAKAARSKATGSKRKR